MKIETRIETLGKSYDGGFNYEDVETFIVDIQQDPEGDGVTVTWDDKTYDLQTIEQILGHMKYLEGVV